MKLKTNKEENIRKNEGRREGYYYSENEAIIQKTNLELLIFKAHFR